MNMDWWNYFLQAISLGLPLCVILQRWWKRKGIEVDHVFLFSGGFIFYLILPITLENIDFYSIYSIPAWGAIFDKVSSSKWTIYFVSCLLLYISFIAGDLWSNKLWNRYAMKRYEYQAKCVTIFLGGAVAVAVFFGYPMARYFSVGYNQSTQIPALGSLTAAVILLLSMAFLYSAKLYDEKGNTRFWRVVVNKGFFCYWLAVVPLVSMGGRVVFVSSILMLAVFYSVYFKKLRPWHILVAFFLMITLTHIIFLFRTDQFKEIINLKQYYNFTGLGITIFSENFNVSFSLLDFLRNYSIPLLRVPVALLSGLISIIPLIILPQKTNLIVGLDELGYSIYSPAGGMNSFVSLMINFGLFGAMAFLFVLSFALGKLKQNRVAPYSAMYIMISGWLGILFFRDLQQAAMKAILEFSILVPLVVAILCAKITRLRSARAKENL